MRISTKGQVTIPIEIRAKLGLLPNTEVGFEIDGDSVRMFRVESADGRGRRIVGRLRGSATSGMSTEEILALTRDDVGDPR